MSAPAFNLEVLTDTVLIMSACIGFSLAFLMGWKTWRNHMRHHVFRPMLAGLTTFLVLNGLSNVYMILHWKDLTIHGYESHFFVALSILVGYLVLLTTVLYSAKHIFEKMDPNFGIDEIAALKRKEEKWTSKQ